MASWHTSSAACGASAGYTMWVRNGATGIRLDSGHCGPGFDTPILSATEQASIRLQMDAAGVSEVIICCVPHASSASASSGSASSGSVTCGVSAPAKATESSC